MSKAEILKKVRANRAPAQPLPSIEGFAPLFEDLIQGFVDTLGKSGGTVVEIASAEAIPAYLQAHFPDAKEIASPYAPAWGNVDWKSIEKPSELQTVDLAVIEAQWAIAENGALWVHQEETGERVLPFITQHLFLVLPKSKVIANMHQAYQHIGRFEGFGVFIAGPSKTADIEQSLVIGAQGARSLTVFLLKD